MTNVKVAFEILDPGKSVPPDYTKSSGHIISDVKMDCARKARWAKDGNRNPEPTNSAYAGVVSRETARIALTYAALNSINAVAAHILKNAHLQAPSSKELFIICGEEFGLENVGKIAIITRHFTVARGQDRIFGSIYAHVWCTLGLLSVRQIQICGRAKFRKTMGQPIGSTFYFT